MIRQQERFEPVEFMIKRLQKELDRNGQWVALRRHEFAQTKSQRRRTKSAAARNRIAKAQQRKAA